MNQKQIPIFGSALALAIFAVYQTAFAVAIAVDAVSGASGGRKTVTVSAIDVTTNTAAITYSESERDGGFRFYYTTTAFASASDTNRATVTKQTVTTRGSGTLRLTGLKPGTKYYYRFQGYYQKSQNSYWATGSLTTLVSTGVLRKTASSAASPENPRDILGRKPGSGSGASVGRGHSTLDIQR